MRAISPQCFSVSAFRRLSSHAAARVDNHRQCITGPTNHTSHLHTEKTEPLISLIKSTSHPQLSLSTSNYFLTFLIWYCSSSVA
ncbi:hypothetical protein RDI58_008908 [Solanum bulbocastanum]|uniref:Uncharacterized protein n=1 Tax=Solanum bulbocastanum TaxID=147425 RepID=A0AAN8TWP8_SOLBU